MQLREAEAAWESRGGFSRARAQAASCEHAAKSVRVTSTSLREPSQVTGRAKAEATCTQCSGAAKWLATVLESSNEADSICYNAVAGAVAGAADASGAEKWMRMPRGSRRLMQGLAPRHREAASGSEM